MGCTSWAFTIDDRGRPLRVLVLGGTTAPGYALVGNAKYPAIATDFEQTFARLEKEPVDMFFEGHGFLFGLEEKRAGRRSFIDPEGYRARIAEAERAFRELLQKQTDVGDARSSTIGKCSPSITSPLATTAVPVRRGTRPSAERVSGAM